MTEQIGAASLRRAQMIGYRYYQDVTFRYLPDEFSPARTILVGLLAPKGDWTIGSEINVPFAIWRWVAAPDSGVISIAAHRVEPAIIPPVDGMSCSTIFDIEPDRSLHRPSLLDLRFEWGDWQDDMDDVPWPKRRPRFYWIRRRVKRARLWVEQWIWVNGKRLSLSLEPLDPRDEGDRDAARA